MRFLEITIRQIFLLLLEFFKKSLKDEKKVVFSLTGSCIGAYLKLPNIHKDPFNHISLSRAPASPMRLTTGNSLPTDYSSLVMVILAAAPAWRDFPLIMANRGEQSSRRTPVPHVKIKPKEA